MKVVHLDGQDWPCCDVCGIPAYFKEIVLAYSKSGDEIEATCSTCRGLVDAGMLRPEIVDGELRYRYWFPEWKAGGLLPKAAA